MGTKISRVLMAWLLVILLLVILAAMVSSVAEAQGGQFWYLTAHYRWQWHNYRWVRIVYPVVCSGYICRPACRNYYGGWAPCR